MLPAKRAKIEMTEETSNQTSLQTELQVMQAEVEPIEAKKNSNQRSDVAVSYRPTYRAVLAKRGYLVRRTLGSGSYSKVKLAYCFGKDRDKAAVKIVDRIKAPKDFQTKFLPRELDIWPKLSHPHIITMLDYFDDGRRVYMILEYADRGDVLRYIQKSGALIDALSKCWCKQLGEAVRYLHDHNITHRDLKLENLLLDTGYSIKLCDFGFVRGECMKDFSKTYCGSKSYAAPEILKGEPYDPKKSDMWAIGVILYIFITGKMPYDESKGNSGVLEEQRKLDFPWHKYKKVTEESRALVIWLFQNDFKSRPDIHDVMNCHWLKTALKIESLQHLAVEGEKHGKPRKKDHDKLPEKRTASEGANVNRSGS